MSDRKPRKRQPTAGIYELFDRLNDENLDLQNQLYIQRNEYEERIRYMQSEIDHLRRTLAAQKKSTKPIFDTIKRFTLGPKNDN